jgi:Zn-dependent peptidase ImmA (M78 family)
MAFITRKKKSLNDTPTDFPEIKNGEDLISFAQDKGIEVSPLDLPKLTQHLGIAMLLEPMKDEESGSLSKDKKGNWIMKVNSLHHPNRQRFTISHELGHFIKHRAIHNTFKDSTFFRNNESNYIEVEANKFAAELLMPKQIFDTYIQNVSSKVEDIAKHFQVSSMAVRIRAKELNYLGHQV